MILAAAVAHCITRCHTAPQGAGFRVELIPHAGNIIAAGLMLTTLALACWWELRKGEKE